MVEDHLKVQTVYCPECGALAGEPCKGVYRQRGKYAGRHKPRQTNHRSRVEFYNSK